LRYDPGIEPIGERERGRGETDCPYFCAVAFDQGVTRRLDRHGDRVLVPAADRPLALALPLERRIEPAVRLGDRAAREPQAGNVGAVGEDAEGHRGSSTHDLSPV